MVHEVGVTGWPAPWFWLAAVSGAVAIGYDLAHAATVPVLGDAPPVGSPGYAARDLCLAVSASAVVAGVARWRPRGVRGLARLGVVSGPVARPVVGVATTVAAVVLGILVTSRHAFSVLGLEDGIVEDLSALLLLAPVPVLAARAVVARRRGGPLAAALLVAVALGMLVLGMEEISWGQRLLGYATPDALAAGNTQGEANLHNLATNKLEIAFYSGTAVACAALALVRRRCDAVGRMDAGAALPSVPVLLVFAPAAALNYDVWNVAPVQFGFWLTCAALARLAAPDDMGLPHRRHRRTVGLVLGLCVALQLTLLATGGELLRVWDATEYRELFTAAGLAVYAWSLRPRRGALRAAGHARGQVTDPLRLDDAVQRRDRG
jgi:hypothetical protein